MSDIAALVVDNLNIWTSAIERKSSSGRGSSKKISCHGIERLRSLILDLAVRGLLLPQNEKDEGAARIVARARKMQAEAIAKKRMRKPKSLAEPLQPPEDVELPKGWEWTRLIDIAEINPKNEADDDADVSFVPMPLVSDRTDGSHDFEPRKWGEIKKGYTHFADGDIALAKITPCFENGKAAIFSGLVGGVGAGTTELHVARPLIDEIARRYLLLNMKTSRFLAEGEANMTGTAGQKRVPRSYFELTPFPLPPLAEQKRIVAKVDELMALCDALERESEDALAAHQTLVETLLATLVNSTDATDLAKNWSRLEKHFDTLFTTEASIDALKQTILDLAVRGRLVEQSVGDEPASSYLALAPSKNDRAPDGYSDLPSGWACSPVGQIIDGMDSGWSPACHPFPAQSEDKWGVLKTTAVQELEYLQEENKELPEKLEPRESAEARAGDILITRAGPTNRVGICCFVPGTRPKLMISDKIIRFRPSSEEMSGRFLALALSAGPAAQHLEGAKSGMASSQVNISQTKLKNTWVMLPPPAEQGRIIAKVDELLAVCNALKSRLSDAVETQRHLADAIVERAAA